LIRIAVVQKHILDYFRMLFESSFMHRIFFAILCIFLLYLVNGDNLANGNGFPPPPWQPRDVVSSNVVSVASPHLTFIINDTFDDDLDGWTFWPGFTGYTLEVDSKTAHLSGDGFTTHIGLEKTLDISSWTNRELILSFDFRAKSSSTTSEVTNSYLSIYDTHSNKLFEEGLVTGGTTDTGWLTYQKDISEVIKGERKIQIVLYLKDHWVSNQNQHNWFDDIKLVDGNSRELFFDTFDDDLDGWSFWTGGIGYELNYDSQSAMISGNKDGTQNGIQKAVDISKWKKGNLFLSFDYRATSAGNNIDMTNVMTSLYDTETHELLFKDYILGGGTTDTGWRTYQKNIYNYVINSDNIIITFSHNDADPGDSKNVNWYDNVWLATEILPPLKQMKKISNISDIECKNGLKLIFKETNNSPACVKPETAEKLVKRGWDYEASKPLSTKSPSDFPIVNEIIEGKVLNISVDNEGSVIIQIDANKNGFLVITIPRSVLDSKIGNDDDDFFVLVNGEEVDFSETKTQFDRTLTIPFSAGAIEIEVIGSFVLSNILEQ